MSEQPAPINLDDEADRLVDLPIIDFLVFERDTNQYVIEFVPDPAVSDEQKEAIIVPMADGFATRVTGLLMELGRVFRLERPVDRIAFAGQGNFSFQAGDWRGSLDRASSPEVTFAVVRVIQVLSMDVQFEFMRQRRVDARRAG